MKFDFVNSNCICSLCKDKDNAYSIVKEKSSEKVASCFRYDNLDIPSNTFLFSLRNMPLMFAVIYLDNRGTLVSKTTYSINVPHKCLSSKFLICFFESFSFLSSHVNLNIHLIIAVSLLICVLL